MRVLALVCICWLLGGCGGYTYHLHRAYGKEDVKKMKVHLESHGYKVLTTTNRDGIYEIRTKRKFAK